MSTTNRIKVFCPTHEIGFTFSGSAEEPIGCPSAPHALREGPRFEDFWSYCCGCQTFQPRPGASVRSSDPACRACGRRIVRRYLCDICGVFTAEVADPPRRRPVELSVDGAPTPSCPGCEIAPATKPVEHRCDDMSIAYATLRSTCPLCREPVSTIVVHEGPVASLVTVPSLPPVQVAAWTPSLPEPPVTPAPPLPRVAPAEAGRTAPNLFPPPSPSSPLPWIAGGALVVGLAALFGITIVIGGRGGAGAVATYGNTNVPPAVASNVNRPSAGAGNTNAGRVDQNVNRPAANTNTAGQPSSSASWRGTIVGRGVNVRKEPSVSADSVKVAEPDEPVEVLASRDVSAPGEGRIVRSSTIDLGGGRALSINKGRGVVILGESDTRYRVRTESKYETYVGYVPKADVSTEPVRWHRVRFANGKEGWVSGEFVRRASG